MHNSANSCIFYAIDVNVKALCCLEQKCGGNFQHRFMSAMSDICQISSGLRVSSKAPHQRKK